VLLPAVTIGGFLTDQLDWRWAFYLNLPIGAVALAIVAFGIHLDAPRAKARIDAAGAGLLTAGILAITLLSTWGGTVYDWFSPQIVALAVTGAAALTVRPVREEPAGGMTGSGARLVTGAAMPVAASCLPQ